MAVFSIIKLSELEGAKRIDAEYYRPEYLTLSKNIDSMGCLKLRNISSLITDGDHGNPEYSDIGIPYITSENLYELGIELHNCKIVSNEYVKKIRKDCFTTEGDILLTTVGKVGILTIAPKNGLALSRDIARIVIKRNNFYPEFIVVYLNSKIGLQMTERESVGSVQKGLYLVQIKNLKIPKIKISFQYKIRALFLEAINFYNQSQTLYSQAENLLLEELGLKDFKPKYEKTYTAKLSDAFSAHRIDAEYFQPAHEEVIKILKKKVKVEKLKNVISFINHGKQPYYIENGDVPVLIQKHLGLQLLSLYTETINMPDTPKTDKNFFKKYPNYLIKPFDVLFYSVGAYLGRTNVVLEDFEAVPASFITLIRTKQEVCNPVYLALFLNSEVGQLQSSKWKSASAQQYIYPKEIKEFIIPILPLSTQQKIASLVQQSHKTRKKAKELLDGAKRAVEIAIDKN